MKQQIVVIHGGSTFERYEDYLSFLNTKELTLEKLLSSRDWKDNLADDLGKNYEVLKPRMPNGTNAKYSEWELWFERIIPFLRKDAILIGHSLGGVFLAKYLSGKTVGKEIKAVVLVSAPYDDESEESLNEFKITSSLEKLKRQAGEIVLVQSKDDPVVPITEIEKYKKALPNARVIILPNGGHFNGESFPQIMKLLKSL